MKSRENTLSALLISPDRSLAEIFIRSLSGARAFEVVSDLKSYPTAQALELRLKQMQPDVVLIDVVSNIDEACEIFRQLNSQAVPVYSVGLDREQNSSAIVKALRAGATEFLSAPFDRAAQIEAASRIGRLLKPAASAERQAATVIAFSSTKPGSGASTVAAQTAFALRRMTSKRVLLADCDVLGGTMGFYLHIEHPYSLATLLDTARRMDDETWNTVVTNVHGVDVLTGPDEPWLLPLDVPRLQEVIDLTRRLYEFVVLDLPTVFEKSSLIAVAHADSAFLVTTPELPSLHLTRKALTMLDGLGFERERFRILINRLSRKDGLDGNDVGKMFSRGIDASLPNDYFSLHRVVSSGEPLPADCELGRALEGLAGKLAGISAPERKRSISLFGAKPIFLQT